jgi:hypothetical protein
VHSEQLLRISNSFIRLLTIKPERREADSPLFPVLGEQETSVRARYAPMTRLLARDDELFLAKQGLPAFARTLRRRHRKCYFRYITRLAKEIRTGRKLSAHAMASQGRWNFRNLLVPVLLSEFSLLYLRWLGIRHAFGTTIAPRDVREGLDFLLAAPRFGLATT